MINNILSFFENKSIFKILVLILLFLIMGLSFALVDVTTGFNEEIKRQEQEMFYEKSLSEVKYYHDEDIIDNYESWVSSIVNCYKNPISNDELDSDIKNKINELNKLYHESSLYFSFIYKDLYTGFTVSYNEDAPIFTASTIKAPAMIYLYEKASLNEIDLNEKLTYTSNFYSGGTGVLQTKPLNTSYSVDELISYTIHDSDNIAYSMLMNRFGRENMRLFWHSKNTKDIFELNTIWGVISARDASIYMKELYEFGTHNKEYGSRLMDYFKNASWKVITDKNGKYNTANKTGWSGTAFHDVAIVFDKNPYVLAIFSNLGESNYNYLFTKTSKLVGNIHNLYWEQKMNKCNEYN